MMLMTRDRSLSGRQTVQAIDYNSFIGQTERSRMDSAHSSAESLAEKQAPDYPELTFSSLLKQISSQLHQLENDNQHPRHHVNNQLSENRPRRDSTLGLPLEGQLYQHLRANHQLSEDQTLRRSLQSLDLPIEGQPPRHEPLSHCSHLQVKHQLSEYQRRRGSLPPLDLLSAAKHHQQEPDSHHHHLHVKHLLPEDQPRRGSLPPLDHHHQQHNDSQQPPLQGNDQLPGTRPRRGSLPSEGFKDVTILDNDYFVAICDDYVKLYSDVGDLVDKLLLDCTPLSLSRFGPDRMVISCYSRRLCVVRIDNGTNLSLQLEVVTAIQYSNVSQLQEDELICAGLDEAVLHRLVYKPNQVVLASVLPLVDFGVTIRHHMSYRYVHVTSSGRIVVTDRMNDYLLSLSVKGNWKIPFIYRPQAVVSDDNHIYVIQGGGLNLVYRFNLDGTNALCILRKEHELTDPWGLSLNRNGKLMLTSNSKGVPGVRVFTGLVAV